MHEQEVHKQDAGAGARGAGAGEGARPTLDHVGHSLAGDIQQPLDVEVVGGEDELEEGSLVNLGTGHMVVFI